MPNTVYYCRECEQMNESETCSNCGKTGAAIHKNTASEVVWKENIDRMIAWCEARRIIPEVE